jgi:hypothetical protein
MGLASPQMTSHPKPVARELAPAWVRSAHKKGPLRSPAGASSLATKALGGASAKKVQAQASMDQAQVSHAFQAIPAEVFHFKELVDAQVGSLSPETALFHATKGCDFI